MRKNTRKTVRDEASKVLTGLNTTLEKNKKLFKTQTSKKQALVAINCFSFDRIANKWRRLFIV